MSLFDDNLEWVSTSYEWIVDRQPGEWPYSQSTWVLTHRPEIVVPGHLVQRFSGDVTRLHPQLLEAASYKDVWMVGGAAAQVLHDGKTTTMHGELIRDRSAVADLYRRYRPATASRVPGVRSARHRVDGRAAAGAAA